MHKASYIIELWLQYEEMADLFEGRYGVEDFDCRNSLKSSVFFLFSEKPFSINSLATYCPHMFEMAVTKSNFKERIRRGPYFPVCADFLMQYHL